MQSQLTELLDLADSEDEDMRRRALARIGLILERSSYRVTKPDGYEVLLEPELLAIQLSEGEQRQIVERLFEVGTSRGMEPSILWAIGKASPFVAIGPVLEVLKDGGKELDEATTFQGVMTLEGLLVARKGKLFPEIARQVSQNSPVAFLEKQARVTTETWPGMPPGRWKVY